MVHYGACEAGRRGEGQETGMGARKSMAMILGACFGRAGPPCAPAPRPLSCCGGGRHDFTATVTQGVRCADSTKNRPVFDRASRVMSRRGPRLHRARARAGGQRRRWACCAPGRQRVRSSALCHARLKLGVSCVCLTRSVALARVVTLHTWIWIRGH